MFIDTSASIGIIRNKINNKNNSSNMIFNNANNVGNNIDNDINSFNSGVANLSLRSGFNIVLLDGLLNIEPSVLTSFNIIKNNNKRYISNVSNIDKFINIIPTLKIGTNIFDSWKFGIIVRNVNTINKSLSSKLSLDTSNLNQETLDIYHLIKGLGKNKSNVEFGLNIEKTMFNNTLNIYGNTFLTKTAKSKPSFNFNLGLKFEF